MIALSLGEYNGCTRQQPCISCCKACTFFHTGEVVQIVNGMAKGSKVILGPQRADYLNHIFFIETVVIDNTNKVSKLPQGLRKIIGVNDISYYIQK